MDYFPRHGLKRRLLTGFGANMYGQAVTFIIQLASVPLFLHFWGIEKYGEWLILSAVPSYLSMSDLGFASVAGNEMAMATSSQDQERALGVFQSTWVMITVVSAAFVVVIIPVVYLVPFGNLLNVHAASPHEVRVVLLLLSAYVLLGLQGGMLSQGFRAIGKYGKGTAWGNSSRLFEWIIAMAALSLGYGMAGVAAGFIIGRVIFYILWWYSLHRDAAWLQFGFRFAHVAIIRRLLRPSIAFMSFPLGLALGIQGIVLIIGVVLGPAAVAIFSVYRTLTRAVVQVVTATNQAFWPELSAAMGKGDVGLARKLYLESSRVSLWLGLIGVVAIGFGGGNILAFWTHKAIGSDPMLLWLLLCSALEQITWQSSWITLMSVNKHQRFSISFLAFRGIGVILAWVLAIEFQIYGVVISLIAIDFPLLYDATNQALKLTGETWQSYLQNFLKSPWITLKRVSRA